MIHQTVFLRFIFLWSHTNNYHRYSKSVYECVSLQRVHVDWKSMTIAESPTKRYTPRSTIGHVPRARFTMFKFISAYHPTATSHQFSAPTSTRTYAKRCIPQSLLKILYIEKITIRKIRTHNTRHPPWSIKDKTKTKRSRWDGFLFYCNDPFWYFGSMSTIASFSKDSLFEKLFDKKIFDL